VIAVLPNGVCRAAGPHLSRVAHPLGVVEPVSTRTRQAVTNTLPALFPDCLPGATASAPLQLPPLSEDTAR
jgi:hypothetical protein